MSDIDEIEEIANLMDAHNLSELTYKKKNGFEVILKKQSTQILSAEEQSVKINTNTEIKNDEVDVQENNNYYITSPMVGTFYDSKDPKSEPYVKVGDKIIAGQILCIIEAMKVMNYMKADRAGTIVRIMESAGTPVEFDQVLFEIGD